MVFEAGKGLAELAMNQSMSKAAIIIPARWASTRMPGKPLHLLAGKPLVRHVWERCSRVPDVDRIIIATDDMRIAEAAFEFGAEVTLTSDKHPCGTDRIAEVAQKLSGFGIIVNVQGDEPFIDPKLPQKLIHVLREDKSLAMSTAACPMEAAELGNSNCVKVVTDLAGHALYFSRAGIPHDRDGDVRPGLLRHLGIYAYRRRFLLDFVKWKQTPLENAEKLEQLRALEHGAKIHVVKTRAAGPGVDTPEDAAAAEKILSKGKSSKKRA
jgi:3-deoxy-manno-octulosonate cytidylyltransferase (CMP-KDO synthetase)